MNPASLLLALLLFLLPACSQSTPIPSPPRTVPLLRLDDHNRPSIVRHASFAAASPAELTNHALALAQKPSVESLTQLVEMLPHSLRYEIADNSIICPYSVILRTILRWTPIDGSKQWINNCYQHSPTKLFALEDAHGRHPDHVLPHWQKDSTQAAADIAYINAWMNQRQGHLTDDFLILERIRAFPFSNTTPYRPPERVQYIIGPILYDPRFDDCNYQNHRPPLNSVPTD